MEKKQISVGAPIKTAGIVIVPVVEQAIAWRKGKKVAVFAASKKPVYVVIAADGTKKAFRLTGEEASLDSLVQEIPEIGDVLKTI